MSHLQITPARESAAHAAAAARLEAAVMTRVDFGHPQPLGTCPKCKRPHGYHVHLSPHHSAVHHSAQPINPQS
jgi:hypothetical protein